MRYSPLVTMLYEEVAEIAAVGNLTFHRCHVGDLPHYSRPADTNLITGTNRARQSLTDNLNTITVMHARCCWNGVAIKANATKEKIVALRRHVANRCILIDNDRLLLTIRSL